MIPAEQATTLDRSVLTARSQKEAFMCSTAYYSTAPWKYTALMKLHTLENAEKSHESCQGGAVSPNAAMFARTVLDGLRGEDLPTPSVCPVSGGSVAMIWTVGVKQLEAIFAPDKSGSFVVSDGDNLVDDGEISVRSAGLLSKALDSILNA
jgi:hypothetical protein